MKNQIIVIIVFYIFLSSSAQAQYDPFWIFHPGNYSHFEPQLIAKAQVKAVKVTRMMNEKVFFWESYQFNENGFITEWRKWHPGRSGIHFDYIYNGKGGLKAFIDSTDLEDVSSINFEYDSSGITRVTASDPNMLYTWDRWTQVLKWEKIKGIKWIDIIHLDTFQNILKWSKIRFSDTTVYKRKYDEQGLLLAKSVTKDPGTELQVISESKFVYEDGILQMIKSISDHSQSQGSNNLYFYYDPNGHLRSTEFEAEGKILSKTEYSVNEDGLVIQSLFLEYNPDKNEFEQGGEVLFDYQMKDN